MANNSFESYRKWVAEELRKRSKDIDHNVQAIITHNNAKGMLYSGASVRRIQRETHEKFEDAVRATLGMLKKGRQVMKPVSDDLRPLTEELLREFMDSTKAASQPKVLDRFKELRAVAELMQEYDRTLESALESFDAGLLDVDELAEPVPSMSISVGRDMIASGIQQGSPGASQQVSYNKGDVLNLINQFEEAMGLSGIPSTPAAAITANLAMMKDLLHQPEPDVSLLRDIGKSVRAIAENVAAMGVGSGLQALAGKLCAALGI